MHEQEKEKKRQLFPMKNPLESIDGFFWDKPLKNFIYQMDEFFRAPMFSRTFRVRMDETEDEYLIYAELPGIHKKQITIDIFQNTITIMVNHSEIQEEKNTNKNYYGKMTTYENMSRTISLPFVINEKKVKAHFENGLLTITIPKEKGKRISIEG